jgi:hypothetical protein
VPFQNSIEARMAGKLGATRRWARATPAERAENAARLNAARHAKFRSEAEAIALAAGYKPSEADLERTARLLQEAHLASIRLRAHLR